MIRRVVSSGALAVLVWVTPANAASPAPSTSELKPLPAFTLAAADPCFDAASAGGPALWPFADQTQPHPLRSGLNDPRTPVHIGDDIWASQNSEWVYAMQSGVIGSAGSQHFRIGTGSPGSGITYWHVTLIRGLASGSRVTAGQSLGRIFGNYWHVHITENVAGCGTVDPRRPAGPLFDPANTEAPAIGPISAKVADRAAFTPVTLTADPARLTDPAHALALDALRGVVDFRASVTDTPLRPPPVNPATGQRFPEHRLAPAAIRGYLAPARGPGRLGAVWTWAGARVQAASTARSALWAFGTWRHDDCYYHWQDPLATCGQDIIYHVAGAGFDTRTVPDGRYSYCVEALTVDGGHALRCQRVTIANP